MEAILYRLKNLLGGHHKKKDISSFFRHASKKEQERVLLKVIDQANEDQKNVVNIKKVKTSLKTP